MPAGKGNRSHSSINMKQICSKYVAYCCPRVVSAQGPLWASAQMSICWAAAPKVPFCRPLVMAELPLPLLPVSM